MFSRWILFSLLSIASTFSIPISLSGYCARCVKIEAEREEEKKRNPQSTSPYYEDQLAFEDKGFFSEDPTLQSNTSSHKLTPKKEGEVDGFSTAALILKAQGLFAALNRPFTLFIPSNEAIQRLGANHLNRMYSPAGLEELSQLLLNHIVSERIDPQDFRLFDAKTVKSVGGRNLTLNSQNGALFIDGARILQVYPLGANGIIYVIDQVLTTPNAPIEVKEAKAHE